MGSIENRFKTKHARPNREWENLQSIWVDCLSLRFIRIFSSVLVKFFFSGGLLLALLSLSSFTRVFRVPHGCHAELKALLRHARLDMRCDTVYFLGDIIGKGPNSIETLREVRALTQASPFIESLMGNHEAGFLRWLDARAAGKPLPPTGNCSPGTKGTEEAPGKPRSHNCRHLPGSAAGSPR